MMRRIPQILTQNKKLLSKVKHVTMHLNMKKSKCSQPETQQTCFDLMKT